MEITVNSFFFDWEVSMMVWLQAHLGGFGTALASFFSLFGETIMFVVVLGYLYWCRDKRTGKAVGLTAMTAFVCGVMIKNIACRVRPYMEHESIKCLKPVEKSADLTDIAAQGFSFPSGHSTNSTSVFASLPRYEKAKWLRVAAVLIPFLCGISRFCLGVHYPTDVLAGWALGVLMVFLVPFLGEKIKNRKLFCALLLLAALPGLFWCKSNDYYTGLGMLIGFMLASAFEEKYVNFENTRSALHTLLRIAGGGAVYVGLNALLKLPFPKEFLESGTMAAMLVRTARYAVIIFADMGLYPMAFKYFKKQ